MLNRYGLFHLASREQAHVGCTAPSWAYCQGVGRPRPNSGRRVPAADAGCGSGGDARRALGPGAVPASGARGPGDDAECRGVVPEGVGVGYPMRPQGVSCLAVRGMNMMRLDLGQGVTSYTLSCWWYVRTTP